MPWDGRTDRDLRGRLPQPRRRLECTAGPSTPDSNGRAGGRPVHPRLHLRPVGHDLRYGSAKPKRSGAEPENAPEAVQDLHTLLQAAKVPGPYVLVGHSLGGLFVRLYASEYPDQVDGMVLVDALPEQLQGQLTADDYARYAGLVAAIPNELASYADLETIDLAASFEQMRQAASAHPTPGDATRRHRPR
jgi:pimeloyl-ACP methyl ester carboxylesterase